MTDSIIYTASATAQGKAFTITGNIVTATATAQASSIISYEDAWFISYGIAEQQANIEAQNSANIIDQTLGIVEEESTGCKGPSGPRGRRGPTGPSGASGLQGPSGPIGPTGPSGLQGASGLQGPSGLQGASGLQGSPRGNTAVVDAVYGNDSTASIGGGPFLTVSAALAAITSGQTVWLLPGRYILLSGITIPNGTSIRGFSLQTTILQMNVTSSTTMITMGENCSVEDLTINLSCTGTTDNVILKGIVFGGTSSQTSKLRTAVLNVQNLTMSKSLTSTVTGVEFSGPGTLSNNSFSFNSLKGSTINVYSNGKGNKRGILVSNSNQASTRDLNIFIAQPPDTDSTGSYVGIETNDPANNLGSIQLRTTTSGVVVPVGVQAYTASDILQTTPATITNPSYLVSPGVIVGPGTDLVTKSAGNKGFSTYIYPTIVYYGLKGNVSSAPAGAWLWVGTSAVSAGQFPDTGTPPAYFRIQQPSLLSGISGSLNVAPTLGTVTLSVQYTPIGDQTPNLGPATMYGSISGTTLTVGTVLGTIQIGQLLIGFGIANRTYIVAGSGLSWTVSISQTVPNNTVMTSTSYKAGATFSGTISGTALTVTSAVTGTIQIGQFLSASSGITSGTTGVLNGTYITGGSGTNWTINQSNPTTSTIEMKTYAIIPTSFEVTFTPSVMNATFYNSSTRLNTGDKLLLYLNYNGTIGNAHDVTAQLDLF